MLSQCAIYVAFRNISPFRCVGGVFSNLTKVIL